MPLRLVSPRTGEQGTAPPKRRKWTPSPALSLTPEEARAVRAAARNIARAHFGTLRKLAAALGVEPKTLTRKEKNPSAGLAVALARVANVSVDSVLGRAGLAALPGGAP